MDSLIEERSYLLKIVILGDASVGKTSLIKRIFNKNFDTCLRTTIGIEFATLEVNDKSNKKNIYVQFWDTSGAEKYRAITKGHLRNTDGIILVFDLTNKNSYNNLEYWHKFINETVPESTPVMLLGNKVDLIEYESERLFSNENLKEFIEEKNIYLFAECSALNNSNIMNPISDFYEYIFIIKSEKLHRNFVSDRRKIDNKKCLSNDNCC